MLGHAGEVTVEVPLRLQVENQEATELRQTGADFVAAQEYNIRDAFSSMVWAQFNYRQSNRRFAHTLDALGGNWSAETEYYQFEFVVTGNAAFTIAKPTHPELHSLIGIVQVIETWEGEGEVFESLDTIYCRSVKPPGQALLIPFESLGKRSQLDCPDSFARLRLGAGNVYVEALNRGQQAYRLEYPHFTAQMEDLGLSMPMETNYHFLEIAFADELQAIHLARSKYKGIPSYVGIVSVLHAEDGFTTTTRVCRSVAQSIDLDIVIPRRTDLTEPAPNCPVGFEGF